MAFWKKAAASLPFRIAFAVFIPLLIVSGLLFRYYVGNPLVCLFHLITHLYCPGCGSGRALLALMHLDIGAALGYNALFVIFLLPLAYYLLKQYLRFVFQKDLLPFPELKNTVGYSIIIIFIVFGFLRNIPVYPFTLLAP